MLYVYCLQSGLPTYLGVNVSASGQDFPFGFIER